MKFIIMALQIFKIFVQLELEANHLITFLFFSFLFFSFLFFYELRTSCCVLTTIIKNLISQNTTYNIYLSKWVTSFCFSYHPHALFTKTCRALLKIKMLKCKILQLL